MMALPKNTAKLYIRQDQKQIIPSLGTEARASPKARDLLFQEAFPRT